MASLQGQIAIVTGAASPIGAAIANRFHEEGATLVLADVNEKGLAVLSGRFPGSTIVAGDLSEEGTAKSLTETALANHGRIDILVNNAGGGVIRPFLDHTPETLRATVDRNLWTMLWCTWHVVPHMKAKGYGRIVNIGADSVRSGLWQHAGYNAAKGGVHAIVSGLAREFAKDGITANAVAPCIVETPNVTRMRGDGTTVGDAIDLMSSIVPIGRPATLAEVASVVRYLASHEASFVTGQVISVNGGSTMQ